MSLAILMRSALVTLTTWTPMLDILERSDAEFFDGHGGTAKPRFKPGHWDSASNAELLQEAASGFPSSKRIKNIGEMALAAFRRERNMSKRFSHGIQPVFYRVFLDGFYADSIPMLIKRRLRTLAADISLPDSFDANAFREAMNGFPKDVIFTLVRCWANACTASVRMHEPLCRDCLFGCAGKPDGLCHYLRCERL